MRIGSVCYATEQGLGRLMKAFYDAGVITDPVIFKHSSWQRKTNLDWYPPGTPILEPKRSFDPAVIGSVVDRVQVMLFFETPFDWEILRYCKDHNVKTVLMPMYEWFPANPPTLPDLFLCPSKLDYDYFSGGLIPKWDGTEAVYLPVPVDSSAWKKRTRAVKYLHNAGNIGHREHKGTRQLLEAMKLVKSPLELTVRAQDVSVLRNIVEGTFGREVCKEIKDDILTLDPVNLAFPRGKGPRLTIRFGQIAYDDLWADHDVYVAPEKFNGLSLPLQEAYAAGLVVMTTDRYPHNTWLPTEPLIPVSEYRKAFVSRNYLEFDEALVTPEAIAAKMDEWYGKDIRTLSKGAYEWGQHNSWRSLKQVYLEVFEDLVEGRPIQQPTFPVLL